MEKKKYNFIGLDITRETQLRLSAFKSSILLGASRKSGRARQLNDMIINMGIGMLERYVSSGKEIEFEDEEVKNDN